jgi:hypothetical protein
MANGRAGFCAPGAPRAVAFLLALSTGLPVHAQEATVLEVDISDYRAEIVPLDPFVCANGRELDGGAQRWILFDADVDGVISGEFEGDSVVFASTWSLNFQCVELLPLPDGGHGQRLRDLGAMYEGRAAECGNFRPRCETDPRFGTRTCYWTGWGLEVPNPVTAAPVEPPQPNLKLIDRFLTVRDFRLVESLADLPADVQSRLSRWEDGSFSMAEKGESWNQTDVSNSCNPRKSSQHWLSGVAADLAVIFFNSGGIAIFSNIQIVDRRTGEALTCFIDGAAMREWNGTNHSDAMFARRPDGLSMCRVPYDATRQ